MYRAGSIFAFVLIAALSIRVAYSQPASLQSTALGARTTNEAIELLHSAMRARVAVSTDKRTGRTIPAYHCRHAAGGCERRLEEFARYLVHAGQNHGIDPWLMAAMALRESGLNPFAMGAVGELGILQINPGRRDARAVRFIRDERYRKLCRREAGACQQEVVNHAAHVLARALELCGNNLEAALSAYNSGRCGGNPAYAKRVLAEFQELRRAAGLTDDAPELPNAGRS